MIGRAVAPLDLRGNAKVRYYCRSFAHPQRVPMDWIASLDVLQCGVCWRQVTGERAARLRRLPRQLGYRVRDVELAFLDGERIRVMLWHPDSLEQAIRAAVRGVRLR